MTQDQKIKYLSLSLRIFGTIFIVGVYPLMMWIWPEGWGWEPRQPEYEQMIMGIYATLGVFLILAARNPIEHLSLIWFTIWSSIVHGGIMLVHAIADENELANLIGDVPALFLIAAVLWVLVPKKREA
ncbi:DUF6632 domain-containing protein [Methylomicrobium lacus]|uniref:DUF6632 domain-containing protein n=1 Tax=Methylomicrobium lacus TaxID=136992 RepID=UPI0035A90CB7